MPSYLSLVVSSKPTIVTSPSTSTSQPAKQTSSASATTTSSTIIVAASVAAAVCLVFICVIIYFSGGIKRLRLERNESGNFADEHRNSIEKENWNIRSTFMKFVSTGDGLEMSMTPYASKKNTVSRDRKAGLFVATAHEDLYPSFEKGFTQKSPVSVYAQSIRRDEEVESPTSNTDVNEYRVSESVRESLIKFYMGSPKSPTTAQMNDNPMSANTDSEIAVDEGINSDLSNIYRENIGNDIEGATSVGKPQSSVFKPDEETI